MESVLARGVQVSLALGGAYLVALWFVLIVWTFRDIETRSRSAVTQVFSTLLAVLFYVPGVMLYLILRPKETLDSAFQRSLEEEYLLQDLEELPLCPNCEHYVEDDFKLCPNCQTVLRDNCLECGRLVDKHWALCPYCGAEQGKGAEIQALPKPVERWALPTVQPRVEVQRPKLSVRRTPATVAEIRAAAAVAEAHDSPRPPVRLFDRRKTRELARLNGSTTSDNGEPPAANETSETEQEKASATSDA
jgi:RNA polymerase subunit RPABC4/transcription elongation factor Spt4